MKNNSTGQDEPQFAPGDILWGAVEVLTSNPQTAYGSTQMSTTGTIRFRGYPTIATLDRLLDTRWNETYLITGVRRGKLEIIVEVERYIGLEGVQDAV